MGSYEMPFIPNLNRTTERIALSSVNQSSPRVELADGLSKSKKMFVLEAYQQGEEPARHLAAYVTFFRD